MIDDYDFFEEDEGYEEYAPDHYFDEAQEEIKSLYENNKDDVFYLRQLQVQLEGRFFHWVTNNALLGLLKIGYLKDYRIESKKGTSTRYFIHHSNRYPMRAIKKLEEVVQEYSKDNITRGCGYRAEDLFCKALALRGFMPVGQKVTKYNGKKWEKTGNDLDFVFSKDMVEYGCEIKNTLGYIDKDELDTKIEMCHFFNVKPLFIMRYSPKSYNKLLFDNEGFALLFKTQIYELGQIELVKRIGEITGLPVISTKSIPDGIIDRFEKWHNKNVAKRK